ncbi:MAG: 1,4-alpha-glucan branching protein domain-containing protein [Verrucomicrobiota bacterium]
MPPARSHLILLLHAHLPYVRHPEQAEFFEECWFFEAVLECYLPILGVLDGWERDDIPGGLALSLSPTLVAMLRDDLLTQRLHRHLSQLLDLAAREELRAHFLPERRAIATGHRIRLEALVQQLQRLPNGIPAAFARHAAAGRVELLTCPATHPTLPLLLEEPGAVRTQLRTALDSHREVFGQAPAGLWLPECAWVPGLDRHLSEHGIRWTVLESHGLLHATPRPRGAVYAPVRTRSGLACFGRDPGSARQVWSRHGGYPGDPRYREFHRDVAHEADWDYVQPYLHGASERGFTGLKFYRITGPGPAKELYDRTAALAAVHQHAAHFVEARARVAREAAGCMTSPPVIVAPYDAELFGHWWFEGPEFLDAVVRRLAEDRDGIRLSLPSRLLEALPDLQLVEPAASTWGEGGHFGVWLDPANAWMEAPVRGAGRRLAALASRLATGNPSALSERRMRQATRELLLAQASDWPFLVKMGSAGTYPATRFREHVAAVHHLADQVEADAPERSDDSLQDLERRHPVFPHLEWRNLASTAESGWR